MVTLWHVLFLACLPAAIVLAFVGQWVAAAGVFFVATPIFWTLRNRAARSEGGDPLARELRGRPTRYAIPSNVRTKLSARSLDDVPGQVRIGSPHDASDADVADALAKLGVLHPRTNYGVVYRVLFAPFLAPGETPKYLRLGWVSMDVASKGHVDNLREENAETSWVLVTDRGMYWHQESDRVPGMPPRHEMERLLAPRRSINFGPRTTGQRTGTHSGPGGVPMEACVIDEIDTSESTWRVAFSIPSDPKTEELLRYIEITVGAQPLRREGREN